jgi:DNA invertase Pin-like site-specific DNA recombinase
MSNKIPCAIYCRVSTQEQSEGLSLEMQVALCKATAEKLGFIPPDAKVYTDISTGSNLLRPGLTALLADLPLIGNVLVYKLDRLTRSGKDWYHLLDTIHGVRYGENYTIISASQGYDLNKPDGRMLAAMLIVVAEFERSLISQRTVDALAKKRGAYDEALPLIASMHAARYSLRDIAAHVGSALGRKICHSTVAYLIAKFGLDGENTH